MSITINFGSSPEEIHSVGELGGDIWDIIFTYKEVMEDDAVVHMLQKFMDINDTVWFNKRNALEYAKKNKIVCSYGGRVSLREIRLRIVFSLFNRKIPSAKPMLAQNYNSWWNQVKNAGNWDQEDINLFILAETQSSSNPRRGPECSCSNEWATGFTEHVCDCCLQDMRQTYTGHPEFLDAMESGWRRGLTTPSEKRRAKIQAWREANPGVGEWG